MRIILGLLMLAAFAAPAFAAKPARQQPVTQLPQWHDFSARQDRSLQALALCEQDTALCESKEVERWAGLVKDLRPQNRLRQIITVNRWFNRLQYKHDEYAYNKLDHWADTAEMLKSRGDCEDMALGKYYTLRQLGFTPDELKVAMVFDRLTNTHHSVVMIYTDGTRYMMDINSDDTDPSPMEYRYKSIYSFNEKTAWFY